MNGKDIPIEVVLSITLDRLLCSIDEHKDAIEFLTGRPCFTTSIPEAAPLACEVILSQHPDLALADALADGWVKSMKGACLPHDSARRGFLADLVTKWHGATHVHCAPTSSLAAS